MTTRKCMRCGAEIADDAPGENCPKCLMGIGLADAYTATQAVPRGDEVVEMTGLLNQTFGDYALLEEIARGGMGVVYKARQKSLNRIVALKLILSGQFASKEQVVRFRAEAEAAANLRHPNIVAIYETGEHDGQHFFSMEFVQGRDLSQMVRERPLSAERAARYVQIIAQAIQHAHEQGTLHRDLKPSNVLIDADDQPRVTDFGLAKKLGGDSGLTVSGQVMGSPGFMPPEQAAGKQSKIGPPADVYGIGAILYHLITGRAPFQAATVAAVLQQVQEQEPVSPRLLNPSAPRDLETICLKCLEKDPAKRYATAQQLADELGRFLQDEPIQARPIGTPEKAWRWCRRKPVVAGLLAALIIAIVLGSSATLWQLRRVAETARQLRARAYASEMNIANHALAEKNLGRALELIRTQTPKPGEADLRGFEWRYLWGRCQDEAYASVEAHDNELHRMALSPDGRFLVTSASDRAVKLWELLPLRDATGRYELRFKKLLHTFTRKGFYYVAVAISPDGKLITATDGANTLVWELPDGRAIQDLAKPEARFFGQSLESPPVFLPRSHALAVRSSDGIRIWNLDSWQMRVLPYTNAEAFAWSADERWLALAQFENSLTEKPHRVIRLLDSNYQMLGQLQGKVANGFIQLSFSPDGRVITSADGGGHVHVWDRETLLLITNFQAHSSWAGVTFSPDSRLMVSGSSGDQFIRLWDMSDWHLKGELVGHSGGVRAVTFTPDGQTLISAGRDRTIKLWRPRVHHADDSIVAADGFIGFTPDSKSGVTLDMNATVKLWDLQTRQAKTLGRFATNKSATAGALSADGSLLAIGFADGTIELRALADGQLQRSMNAGKVPVDKLRVAPDGRYVAAILDPCPGGEFVLWDATSGESMREATNYVGGSATSFAFAHRHPLVAIGRHDDHSITIWDLAQNRELRRLRDHTWVVNTVTFSPDDALLSSSSWDGTMRLWDLATGENRGYINGHGISAEGGEFSPDGQTLAIRIKQGITLWHVPARQELITLDLRVQGGGDLFFSPDGNTLATGAAIWGTSYLDVKGGVQFWRAPALKEIDAPRAQTASATR